MKEHLYRRLAGTVQARLNCIRLNQAEWKATHEERVLKLVKDHMPSGSGFDTGTKIDLEKSHGELLVFDTSFHHMDEHGGYDGWTEHTVRVKGSLAFGFNLTISGRDRNDIKEYIADMFQLALVQEVD